MIMKLNRRTRAGFLLTVALLSSCAPKVYGTGWGAAGNCGEWKQSVQHNGSQLNGPVYSPPSDAHGPGLNSLSYSRPVMQGHQGSNSRLGPPAGSPPNPHSPLYLKVHDQVIIHGLTEQTNLNNMQGVVQKWSTRFRCSTCKGKGKTGCFDCKACDGTGKDNGRWEVKLLNKKIKALKPENLHRIPNSLRIQMRKDKGKYISSTYETYTVRPHLDRGGERVFKFDTPGNKKLFEWRFKGFKRDNEIRGPREQLSKHTKIPYRRILIGMERICNQNGGLTCNRWLVLDAAGILFLEQLLALDYTEKNWGSWMIGRKTPKPANTYAWVEAYETWRNANGIMKICEAAVKAIHFADRNILKGKGFPLADTCTNRRRLGDNPQQAPMHPVNPNRDARRRLTDNDSPALHRIRRLRRRLQFEYSEKRTNELS